MVGRTGAGASAPRLTAVYALGMTAPLLLLLLAALWDRFDLGRRRWLRGRTLTWGPISVHTTSLVAGLMFVAIGVMFLRFYGTAGITGFLGTGDTVDLEFAAQQAVSEWAAALPAWLLPAVVLLVAGSWRHAGLPAVTRRRTAIRKRVYATRSGWGRAEIESSWWCLTVHTYD